MQEATIKILTPQTSNGLNNIMENGQMVYRESIVPAGQRKFFEKLNTQLPDNLKHRIEDVKQEEAVPVVKEPSDQEKRIAELEAKLALAEVGQEQAKAVTPRGDDVAPPAIETKPKRNEKAESTVLP